MAIVAFALNSDTSRILSEIQVPGERESQKHVTLLFLGDDVPVERLAKAMEAAYQVAATTRPFTLRTDTVTCFPKNPGGVPIICKIESEELHALHDRLKAAFDEAGIEYSKKWPDFKPHVTLAYADEEIEDISIPPMEWGAHELIIWGGNSGDQRVIIHIPFSLKNRTASVVRRFLRD